MPTKPVREDIHSQLVTKYGKPTKINPMEFDNSVGAKVPYNEYEWSSDGKVLTFDEIGSTLGFAELVVFDRGLVAQLKALTTPNRI